MQKLDDALLAAHAIDDGVALAGLYRQAGDGALNAGEIDAGCFYLTHAYIFGLQEGLAEAAETHAILVKYGREE